jgi:hypothetical protein
VQRVEVRRLTGVLRVPDREETEHDARNGGRVEEGVTELHQQTRAASTDAVEQNSCELIKKLLEMTSWHGNMSSITEASEGDVPGDHQCRMKIELFGGILEAVAGAIEDNPEDGHHDGRQQQDAREHHDEDVLAP